MTKVRRKLGLIWRWRKAAAIAIAIIGTVAIGNVFIPQVEAQQRDKLGLPLPGAPVEAADPAKMAFPLPDRPSIAVLPFDNFTGDPKDELLVDSFTEDITTALARMPSFFVISRTTTSTYKGKSVKVEQVAEELGVQFVVEGSVQRDGERIRVTAQLIDAVSGRHVWAHRYERDMTNLFDVLDEITLNIISNIGAELAVGEVARATRRETDSLEGHTTESCRQRQAIPHTRGSR